jgi:tRNA threonylcarbamoyladenosine biosynthesis protein TsaE
VTLRRAPLLVASTASAEATRALAFAVATLAESGDILALAGDLGTGKTVWVQGFARGLGVAEQVTSPTFTLVRPYRGHKLTLLHADLYRLDRLSEVVDLGLLEQLDERAVACIEWGDLAEAVLPADLLDVRLAYGDGEEDRTITLRPVGAGWGRRVDDLVRAVSPWLSAQ